MRCECCDAFWPNTGRRFAARRAHTSRVCWRVVRYNLTRLPVFWEYAESWYEQVHLPLRTHLRAGPGILRAGKGAFTHWWKVAGYPAYEQFQLRAAPADRFTPAFVRLGLFDPVKMSWTVDAPERAARLGMKMPTGHKR